MVHLRPPLLRAPRRHRQDGGHHEVDGDHVHDALGYAGEFAEQAAGIGHDDGLRHPEAADPAGPGFRQRGLNDRGPHERDRHPAFPLLDEGPLAERLRERIGVGPPQRQRACRARRHQLAAHPLVAEFLGLRGDQVIAGGADLRACLLGERAQPLGFARLGFQVVAQASGRGHLGLPRDIEREAVLAEQLLLGLTLVGAGDIGGRDRDEVRGRSGLCDGGRHPGRAEKVDLDGLGQWSVEGDGGGRVDDHVRRGQRAAALLVEPEPVAAHVAGDGVDPSRHLLVEAVSKLRAQAVEAVVLDHLAGESGGGVRPGARAARARSPRHRGRSGGCARPGRCRETPWRR